MALENARRLDRERVLTLLYEVEMKDEAAVDVIESLPVAPDPFVIETVQGVDKESFELDQIIGSHAHKWDVDRMASVDRNILRIGAWELRHRPELSIAIVINEALELTKTFSTEESGKFVNGILSAIAERERPS